MYKIAFLGDKKSTSLYQPSGFSLFCPKSAKETEAVIKDLMKGYDYAVIFVTEAIYTGARPFINSLNGQLLPSVVVVPGYGEKDSSGLKRLAQLTENAVGFSI
ncbi:MAG: V-type ATP synthase subunit F [Oscillospiraceae bacterium]